MIDKYSEKHKEEDAELLKKEQERKKDYLAREKVLQEAGKLHEMESAKKREAENVLLTAREQVRKQQYQAREKALAEDNAAKKLKNKKQQSQ